MKSTGIVRRIDDLGRIVLPIEIRNTMNIKTRDALEIFVLGREEQMILVSRFDNLGKGASGAAVQCMNLALGLPETTGLATDL